jgi:hypothetical protein
VAEPAFGDPDLHGVILERQESQAEGPSRSFGRDRGAAEGCSDACAVKVPGPACPSRNRPDPGGQSSALECLLARGRCVALDDRHAASKHSFERVPAERGWYCEPDLPAR